MVRVCTMCGQSKDIGEFYKVSRPTGEEIKGKCKPCYSADGNKRYHQNHKQELERSRRYRGENPDKRRQVARESYLRRKDKHLAACEKWRKANLEKVRFSMRARAQRRRFGSGIITKQEFDGIISAQGGRCAICKIKFTADAPATMDHIIPLSLGGENHKRNIQAAHGSCNSRKYNHPMGEFMRREFGLLL